MARLSITTFVSLDGVMQAPGGPDEDTASGFRLGGWMVPFLDEDFGREMDAIFQRPTAFLLGRGTYDIFAAWWPKVTDPADHVAAKLNGLPKYVASRTRTAFDWTNTRHIARVPEDVAALKASLDGELQVHGSAGLAQSLLRTDLVDEINLLTFPVVLGGGKRLLEPGLLPATFRVEHTAPLRLGGHFARLVRAGEVVTGTVGG